MWHAHIHGELKEWGVINFDVCVDDPQIKSKISSLKDGTLLIVTGLSCSIQSYFFLMDQDPKM